MLNKTRVNAAFSSFFEGHIEGHKKQNLLSAECESAIYVYLHSKSTRLMDRRAVDVLQNIKTIFGWPPKKEDNKTLSNTKSVRKLWINTTLRKFSYFEVSC